MPTEQSQVTDKPIESVPIDNAAKKKRQKFIWIVLIFLVGLPTIMAAGFLIYKPLEFADSLDFEGTKKQQEFVLNEFYKKYQKDITIANSDYRWNSNGGKSLSMLGYPNDNSNDYFTLGLGLKDKKDPTGVFSESYQKIIETRRFYDTGGIDLFTPINKDAIAILEPDYTDGKETGNLQMTLIIPDKEAFSTGEENFGDYFNKKYQTELTSALETLRTKNEYSSKPISYIALTFIVPTDLEIWQIQLQYPGLETYCGLPNDSIWEGLNILQQMEDCEKRDWPYRSMKLSEQISDGYPIMLQVFMYYRNGLINYFELNS